MFEGWTRRSFLLMAPCQVSDQRIVRKAEESGATYKSIMASRGLMKRNTIYSSTT